MDPYEFKQFVAEVWEELGYRTEVTSGSQDRGIDVIAEKDIPVKQKMLIQTKAYSEKNKVGSGEVRNYATLYQQDDYINQVVIVTTGFFTSEAEVLSDNMDVETIDRTELMEIIEESVTVLSETSGGIANRAFRVSDDYPSHRQREDDNSQDPATDGKQYDSRLAWGVQTQTEQPTDDTESSDQADYYEAGRHSTNVISESYKQSFQYRLTKVRQAILLIVSICLILSIITFLSPRFQGISIIFILVGIGFTI